MLKNVNLKLNFIYFELGQKKNFDTRVIIRVKAWGENITTTN